MVFFVTPRPSPRKCYLVCKDAFPPTGNIRREKLFKYAKYGRPGVKTEYNEKYRDWNDAKSKYDYVSVSMYSQKMLNKARKGPVGEGFPCACFTGTFDGKNVEKLVPLDPYADEWFDDPELPRVLKAQPATLHERPAERKVCPGARPYQHHSETEIAQSQSMHAKMNFIKDHIKRKGDDQSIRQVASASNVCGGVLPPKRREAWATNSAASLTEAKKVRRKNSFELYEDSPEMVRMRDINRTINPPYKAETKQYREPKPAQVQYASSADTIRRVHSDTLVSQQPTPPPSQKGIRKKVRPATSVGPRKKYNIDGRPDQRVKRIYKNLSNQDKKFLNNMYDGLIELQNRFPNKDKEDIEYEQNRLYDEARRAKEYPYNCGAQKEMTNSLVKDYRYWQAVDFETPPTCAPGVHKKQIPSSRARELALAEASQGRGREAKPNGQDRKEKHAVTYDDEPIQHFSKRPQDPEEVYQQGDVYFDDVQEDEEKEEREKIIYDGNRMLEKVKRKTEEDYGKYSTYDITFKNWRTKGKPETPIWAEKTFKSLGSGFWDLPFNKDEGWKKRERFIAARENATYEAEAGQRKELRDAASKVKDPFIARYYPQFRTTQSYLSEYLRQYHEMPLPKRQGVV